MRPPSPVTSGRLWTIAVPTIAFLLLGWAWAWASPPGSAADDDFHMASIWCAWGSSGSCVKDAASGSVFVPDKVANASCFALTGGENASCTNALTDNMVVSTRVNPSFGSYPPVYYGTMRVFVGPDVNRSVVLMRMFNVALAAFLLAFALALAKPVVRRALALAWMVCLVPTGLFFISSMNPSSWAITGGALFWAFFHTLVTEPSFRSRRAIAAAVGALFCILISVGARSDSAFVIILSMAAVAIVAFPRLRGRLHLLWLGLAAIPLVIIAGAFSVGRYLQYNPSFPPGNPEWDQPNAVLKLLLELPAYLAGIVGGQSPSWSQRASSVDAQMPGFTWPGFTFGTGWTDVQNPSIAGVLTLACVAGVIFLGMSSHGWRKVGAIAMLVVALTAQILLMRSLFGFGPTWFLQPRYFFATVLVIVAFTAMTYPRARSPLNKGQATLLVGALTTAYAVSLLATIGRYTYGQNHTWTGISAEPGWWWSVGPGPMVVAGLGAAAGLVWLASMALLVLRAGREPALLQ